MDLYNGRPNNNDQKGVIKVIANIIAFLAINIPKISAFACFYISPLVIFASFYFYFKSVLYAGEVPESGVINNQYFIIYFNLIVIIIIGVLYTINNNIDRLFYNLKTFVFDTEKNRKELKAREPQKPVAESKEPPTVQRTDEDETRNEINFTEVAYEYNNDLNSSLFMTLYFTLQFKGQFDVIWTLLFEDKNVEKLFAPTEIDIKNGVFRIDLVFKDINKKKDVKTMKNIFNTIMSLCVCDKNNPSLILPSFTLKFDEEKYNDKHEKEIKEEK